MTRLILSIMILMLFQLARADVPTGSKRVLFEGAGGEPFEIGSLEISRSGDGYRFDFSLEDSNFSDQFLSMRPFKCIDGKPMYCHLAYPYDKPETFTAKDFGNLEYEFLFIVRSPSEYGIDPYNGRYYVLSLEDGVLRGEAKAVDLNILAAPPDAGVSRPITEAELDYIEVEAERFPRLVIR